MIPNKKLVFAFLGGVALLISACSGVKQTAAGGGGTGGGKTFTVAGSISGMTGTGLVLLDTIGGSTPVKDTLTIAAGAATFTFKTAVPSSGTYAVTVQTQPTNPTQTCTVTSGSGTASANVTTVAVACTTNAVTATIGGTISGLAPGASAILQDNGGDALTLTANGPFTFKTSVTGPTDAYAVTVNTQPTSPNQICTVTNGSGTASANVTNVAVNCVLSYTIGGTVTGLVGTGFALQDQDGTILDTLQVPAATGNQAFTFKQFVPTGSTYNVTVSAQPTGPAQTCVVSPGTGTGTATANVTSVVVTCPAVTYSVGGNIVGLKGILSNNGPLTDSSFVIQNVLGNSLIVPQNGPFTFATPEALNDQYQVSILHAPSSQPLQGCTLWNYKGVVTANVTSIIIDCAHNDWTWIDGTKTAGTITAPQYGSFPTTAPTTIPNPFTNTPGARYGASGWTDKGGNLWLFGGDGWELTGKNPPDTLDAVTNEMWACVKFGVDYCEWQLVGGYNTTYGKAIIANAQNVGTPPLPFAIPPARLGAASWTDASGNFWLFGGSDGARFMNDLWEFNTTSLAPYDMNTLLTTTASWTVVSGGALDQPGVYPPSTTPPPYPGARTNAVTWTDSSGNFWLFGGYGYDGQSPAPVLGFLNDLWEYTTPTTKQWVFVAGSNKANQLGVYGTPGTALSTNLPGGRQEAVGWADTKGNLWLFGGEGEDSAGTANGILNDLWVFNLTSKQWTFVMGATTANQTGVYGPQPSVGPPNTTGAAGTFGLTSASNSTFPGSRWGASGWVDQGGNFWLFGGWGLDATATNGNGALNDFWVYVPNATAGQPGSWTWINGSNTGSPNGVYGDMVIPYKTYEIWTPGGRSNATHWIDNTGQLWLFGGEGYDSTSTTGNGFLNDMWRYLPYPD